jgi:hypothetical protein
MSNQQPLRSASEMYPERRPVQEIASSDSAESIVPNYSEKKARDLEIEAVDAQDNDDSISGTRLYIPDDNDEFIDPRLKDYPIPLVA